MNYQLDAARLAQLVRTQRAGRPLREVAQELSDKGAPISPATLSRVENEKAPDLATFLVLCNWLNISPSQFLFDTHRPGADLPLDTAAELALRVKSDPLLTPAAANVLAVLIEAAYSSPSLRA